MVCAVYETLLAIREFADVLVFKGCPKLLRVNGFCEVDTGLNSRGVTVLNSLSFLFSADVSTDNVYQSAEMVGVSLLAEFSYCLFHTESREEFDDVSAKSNNGCSPRLDLCLVSDQSAREGYWLGSICYCGF